MQPHCRDLGAEDLVPGARFCKECFRYKTKEHECRDFVYGGATLVSLVERMGKKPHWKVRKE